MPRVWTVKYDPELALERHHNCANAKLLRAVLEDEEADLLVFPIGYYGDGLPSETPFVVTALEPCNICGALPSMWAQWKRELVVL